MLKIYDLCSYVVFFMRFRRFHDDCSSSWVEVVSNYRYIRSPSGSISCFIFETKCGVCVTLVIDEDIDYLSAGVTGGFIEDIFSQYRLSSE